jgi:uncharacterized membrane protein
MIIKITHAISILVDCRTVFDYISNLENDKFWRKEINSTTVSAKPQLNTVATESSFLSKRVPNNILTLKCTAFVENQQVVYQTLPDSVFYLKSDRKVEAISQNETKVIYAIEFDKSIVKHGLGFTLPVFIVEFVAKNDMKKYLTKLKTIVENKSNPPK